MLGAVLLEVLGQFFTVLALLMLNGAASVPAIAYASIVLITVLVPSPLLARSVHSCNCLLLGTTLRVSCSLLLYGVIALAVSRHCVI